MMKAVAIITSIAIKGGLKSTGNLDGGGVVVVADVDADEVVVIGNIDE